MSHLSFAGQSEIDYCIECAVKHSQTAKVLAREALQRAEADSPAASGVKEKIRGVIEELSGMEDDTDTAEENENVRNLNMAARELRKHIYTTKAEIGGASIETIRSLKTLVDQIVDLSYRTREAEEICVPCVSPLICKENKEECVSFLEEAAESGDKKKFSQAVEQAGKKYGGPLLKHEDVPSVEEVEEVDLEGYGAEASKKRKSFLEELKREAATE